MTWVAVAVIVILLISRWIARHPAQVHPGATGWSEPADDGAGNGRHLASRNRRYEPGNLLGPALLASLAGLTIAGWAIGTLVDSVPGGHDAALDQSVAHALVSRRVGWLTTAMHAATWLGSTVVLVPFVLVLGVTARLRARSWAVGAQLVLSLGGAVALNNLLKALVGRPRPDVDPLVSTVSGFAFPSGHATQTAAVAVTLAILASALAGHRAGEAAAWSVAMGTVIVVGFSRVYLGVHWPTDVLAGALLGAGWAALTAAALRWSTSKREGEAVAAERTGP